MTPFRFGHAPRRNRGASLLIPESVSCSLDDLVEADVVPCQLRDTAAALSFDGTAVLMAIGGRRRHRPSADARVSDVSTRSTTL
ncbi:hypothetical protein [Bradyrhizobium sp. WU425]|uniref:hypothetical protein n=1 Tax=Bradyrhizobium sp. WU425 TaxID=187029 RepID=UPI001E414557|nr:hypothetical protein [Bradyrhizobium canariense]UFW72883.1 hypothetical protein BcanWU425_03685 [Bradyrhizobium canariense]